MDFHLGLLRFSTQTENTVMLSETKHLLFSIAKYKQTLRCARVDNEVAK